MGESEATLTEFGVDPNKAWRGISTPRLLPIEPLISRAKSTFESIRLLRADIRPLSFSSPVIISSANLTGERISYGGARYFFPNSSARWEVLYRNETQAPWVFNYRQEVDGAVDEKKRNILKGGEDLSVVTPFRVTEPVRATAKSECRGIARMFDSVRKDYNVGVLRYRERPLSEFPDGRAFDCGTGWASWTPIREHEIHRVEIRDTVRNAIRIGDTYYRLPGTEMTITRETRVTNLSGATVAFMNISGLVLINVYEDGNRWCRVHNWTTLTWRKVGDRVTMTRTRTITVPNWIHGKLFLWNSSFTVPFSGGDNEFVALTEYKVGDMIPP